MRELIFADFAKFSEVREKFFCEKFRILSNRKNKLSQKNFLYIPFLNAFLVVFGEKKQTRNKNKEIKSFTVSEKRPCAGLLNFPRVMAIRVRAPGTKNSMV